MAVHTFRLTFSEDALNAINGEGSVLANATAPEVLVAVEVDPPMLQDTKVEAHRLGWEYVGTGDQTPGSQALTQTYSQSATTLPAFTAPAITSTYSGGLLSLLDAARLDDLNALAAKCATLEAHVVSLTKFVNALVDALQAGQRIA